MGSTNAQYKDNKTAWGTRNCIQQMIPIFMAILLFIIIPCLFMLMITPRNFVCASSTFIMSIRMFKPVCVFVFGTKKYIVCSDNLFTLNHSGTANAAFAQVGLQYCLVIALVPYKYYWLSSLTICYTLVSQESLRRLVTHILAYSYSLQFCHQL